MTEVGGNETILVVEDEPNILSMARAMLKELGYRVLTAAAPDKALTLVGDGAGAIDLLMTDVVMPGMNGRELADRLRSASPDLKVLFMSGYSERVIARRGVLEEGVRFIQKPFSIKELATKVREALEPRPKGTPPSHGTP